MLAILRCYRTSAGNDFFTPNVKRNGSQVFLPLENVLTYRCASVLMYRNDPDNPITDTTGAVAAFALRGQVQTVCGHSALSCQRLKATHTRLWQILRADVRRER